MAADNMQDRLDIARHYLEIGNPKRALSELDKGGPVAETIVINRARLSR